MDLDLNVDLYFCQGITFWLSLLRFIFMVFYMCLMLQDCICLYNAHFKVSDKFIRNLDFVVYLSLALLVILFPYFVLNFPEEGLSIIYSKRSCNTLTVFCGILAIICHFFTLNADLLNLG